MCVSMLYQTVQILVAFFYNLVQQITQKVVVVKLKFLFHSPYGMKRLISHVRLLFNIQLVHLFSNAFETARYNMIIHVIVFLVRVAILQIGGPRKTAPSITCI